MKQYEVWCETLFSQPKFVDTFFERENAQYHVDKLYRTRQCDPYEVFTVKEKEVENDTL